MTDTYSSAHSNTANPSNTMNSIENSLENSLHKTADTLRPVVDHLVASTQDAAQRLASVASQAADQVELSGTYLKESQARMVSSCRGFVREKPLTSVGIAVAGGYLLNWMLRQR